MQLSSSPCTRVQTKHRRRKKRKEKKIIITHQFKSNWQSNDKREKSIKENRTKQHDWKPTTSEIDESKKTGELKQRIYLRHWHNMTTTIHERDQATDQLFLLSMKDFRHHITQRLSSRLGKPETRKRFDYLLLMLSAMEIAGSFRVIRVRAVFPSFRFLGYKEANIQIDSWQRCSAHSMCHMLGQTIPSWKKSDGKNMRRLGGRGESPNDIDQYTAKDKLKNSISSIPASFRVSKSPSFHPEYTFFALIFHSSFHSSQSKLVMSKSLGRKPGIYFFL